MTSSRPLNLSAKLHGGSLEINLSVTSTDTIQSLKVKIASKFDVNEESHSLIVPDRKEMLCHDSTKTIHELNLKDRDVLVLIPSDDAVLQSYQPAKAKTSGGGFDFAAFGNAIKNVTAPSSRSNNPPGAMPMRVPNRPATWEETEKKIRESVKNDGKTRADAERQLKVFLDEKAQNVTQSIDSITLMHPDLGAALRTENVETISQAMENLIVSQNKEQWDEAQKLIRAQQNPTSVEAQAILMENARKNYHNDQAQLMGELMENYDEKVNMLYIPMCIKEHTSGEWAELQAFVDTGCQRSIMSMKQCKELGCENLIDRRAAQVAVGVGVGKMLGIIHMLPAKIGNSEFFFSCMIMEGSPDLMFGLDLMKKFKASMDFDKMTMDILGESIAFVIGKKEKKIQDEAANAQQIADKPLRRPSSMTMTDGDVPLTPAQEEKELKASLVAIVCSATGVDRDLALKYLEDSGWDSDLAVALIMSTQ